MKAALFHQFGPPDVVQIENVHKPSPKSGQLLVKVSAAAVTVADSRIRGSNFPPGLKHLARLAFGIFRPRQKILGSCFSGTIQAIGKDVTQFRVGDEVFGMKGMEFGAHAEYLTVGENQAVIKKPAFMSHTEAAAMSFGATTALFFLRDKGMVARGQRVLINGASGSVGTSAVQIAKHYGAHVTGVCSSTNAALVKTLGADEVINYKKTNPTNKESTYDLILDIVGNLNTEDCEKMLKQNGKWIMVTASLQKMLQANLPFMRKKSPKNIRLIDGVAAEKKEDLEFLTDLVANKKLKIIVSQKYRFADIVKAHRLIDSGRKVGNVVVEF
jgi:NADPH:quinone reductase-like Zn-dependent oxidoreductase